MAIELVVPKVGESITEVQIAEWLKKEGDRVERDGNVAVIETDKATVELPAPAGGILAKVLKAKGATAKVGEVIGYIEEGPAGAGARPAESGAKPAPEGKSSGMDFGPETGKVAVIRKDEAAPRPSAAASGAPATVMPAAARALAENGLQASDVQATGPGNRLLKEDVLRQVEAKANAPAGLPAGGAPAASSPSAGPAPVSGDRSEEAVPMSMLRRKVAERLVQAQQTAALLTTFNEIDMTEMMELRKRHQDAFVKKYGIKLGFMSFFVKAAVEALKLIPQINAEIRGNEILYKHYYDIGVAVGGGKGLVVPVLRNVERMGFAQVELAIADLAKRAQANSLKLEELQGGTFTISNGGVYGSLLSTPIVNPPQSGVLGMHAVQDRPVARDGQVVIRPMMYVALTYDHRIVDGREAVTFLKRIKDTLEDPARILLEI
ncbi:MAG TPA: 2-oxoglutarate dehydrogenase complex dihydrolipoyllysine-residue succinyltransferase [Fibrobacteria bacterium]|nr:2-oxoglutarate dehydrogenase complex dihydrolipoyllysine-residue succinyltransferase [Fibrobacteria bacterium]